MRDYLGVLLVMVWVVGCESKSVDQRKFPAGNPTPEALAAFARFQAAFAEFLRTHSNATIPAPHRPERWNPPDIDHEISLGPVRELPQ